MSSIRVTNPFFAKSNGRGAAARTRLLDVNAPNPEAACGVCGAAGATVPSPANNAVQYCHRVECVLAAWTADVAGGTAHMTFNNSVSNNVNGDGAFCPQYYVNEGAGGGEGAEQSAGKEEKASTEIREKSVGRAELISLLSHSSDGVQCRGALPHSAAAGGMLRVERRATSTAVSSRVMRRTESTPTPRRGALPRSALRMKTFGIRPGEHPDEEGRDQIYSTSDLLDIGSRSWRGREGGRLRGTPDEGGGDGGEDSEDNEDDEEDEETA